MKIRLFSGANIILLMIISIACGKKSEQADFPLHSEDYFAAYTYKNINPGVNGRPGVIPGLPDPHVFYDDTAEKWFATGTTGKNSVMLYSSHDLITWGNPKVLLTINDISWADVSIGGLWGAELYRKGDTYYLFYSIWCDTSKVSGSNSPRTGVATCPTVDGKYTDKGEPLFNYGYSVIENNLFRDGDNAYLIYARDALDNVVNGRHESHIYIVAFNDDWMSVKDERQAVELLRPDREWEMLDEDIEKDGNKWAWVEGCYMQKFEENGKYYLFYSANKFYSHNYSIGYAVSDSPTGPFVKNETNPWLMTCSDDWSGPGNNSFFRSRDGKEWFTAYHMHITPAAPSGRRYLNIDRVGLRPDGSVFISGPTETGQPLPSGEKPGHTLISKEATVSVNSTGQGNPSMLNDGEFVVLDKYEDHQWTSQGVGSDEFVKLDWGKETRINSIYIYNSTFARYQTAKINVEFDDGKMIRDISLPVMNGKAEALHFDSHKTSWIKITIAEKGFGQLGMGFSEIMVFGFGE